MNKRGISAVVATVLIILITVAAVTIIWTAVIPMIKNQASFENELVNLDIETAGGYTVWDEENGLVTLQIKRGTDNISLSAVEFVFTIGGNSEKDRRSDVPGPNQKKTYNFNLTNFGEPDKIAIAPVFEDGSVGSLTTLLNAPFPKGDLSGVGGTFPELGEGLLTGGAVYYLDSDGDGYGDDANTASSAGEGYVLVGRDCDDSNILVFPGAQEIYNSGVDEDCDDYDNLNGCGTLNVGGVNYKLENDIIATSNCFVISVNNVVLDMNGYNITGNKANTGVSITGSNSKLMNGKIYNFATDVSVSGAANNITNMTIISSGSTIGVAVYGVSVTGNGNYISNSVISHNSPIIQYSYGLYISSSNNVVNDMVIYDIKASNNGYGVYLNGYTPQGNNSISRVSASGSNYGIYLSDASSGNSITDFTATSNSFGLRMYGDVNKPSNNIFTRVSSSGGWFGMEITGSHNKIVDSIISGSMYSVMIDGFGAHVNNTFLNSSITETVQSGGQLIRKWYFSSQTNYAHNGAVVSGANITAYNVTRSPQISELTDGSGKTSIWELTQYVNNGGTKTYYTNYTVNATLAGWRTDSQSINLTTNILNRQFYMEEFMIL